MILIMFEEFSQLGRSLSARPRNFRSGQLVFHQEARITRLFLVLSGVVTLCRHGASGQVITIHRCHGPAILAEASLHATHYHCDGLAETDCELLSIDRASILREVELDSALHQKWSAYLARQLLAARSRSEIIALKTVAERLDAWLLLNESEIPERGERHILASELAVTPEALYREISLRRRQSRMA